MALVVLDQLECLRLRWAAELEQHVDPLENRRVLSITDGFQADVDLIEPNPHISGAALHQKNPTSRNPSEEGVRRRDLLARPTKMRWLVDDELVVSNPVQRAPGCRGAGGVNPVNDRFVTGHSFSMQRVRLCSPRHDSDLTWDCETALA